MSLSSREAFKLAFLSVCADAGMTSDEMLQTVKRASAALAAKQAEDSIVKDVVKPVGGALFRTYSALAKYAPWLAAGALAVPPTVGYLAGRSAGSAVGEIHERDVGEAKMEEQLAAYQRETERAKARNLLATMRRQGRQSGRPLLV